MKTEAYRHTLRTLADWDQFLMQESGLPGPRGNLELMQAVADEGTLDLFLRYLSLHPRSGFHQFAGRIPGDVWCGGPRTLIGRR